MKHFQIIVKDLDENKVIRNEETDCIIGSFASERDGEPTIAGLIQTNCPMKTIIATIKGCEAAVMKSKEQIVHEFIGHITDK